MTDTKHQPARTLVDSELKWLEFVREAGSKSQARYVCQDERAVYSVSKGKSLSIIHNERARKIIQTSMRVLRGPSL